MTMASLSLSLFVGGFLVGALAILALELLGLLYVIKRLNHKNTRLKQRQEESTTQDLDPHQSLDFPLHKQGTIWVLESDKVAKIRVADSVPREQKSKRDLVEVFPVRKFAKVRDCSLILTGSDASRSTISLRGCIIQAVSSTSLPSRKWAKRFPIKVESKTSVIYNGNRIIYIYLETSWEKESWCKALRLASCDDKKKLDWVAKLIEDFHSYLASLSTGYPSFMKPSAGFNVEPFIDRSNRLDGSSSKVRLLWKKLARKASKPGLENKANWTSFGREDRKNTEKFRPFQESALVSNLVKTAPMAKTPNSSTEETMVLPSSTSIPSSGSQNNISVASDADSEDKVIDEGTLCWNLLISRLFFDAKSSSQMKSSIQAQIQRTLSNMRTPSYIGEVICNSIDLGSLPPYIHGMRVLPADMNEVWALEADVEYSGGLVLDIETRLEVRELGLQKGIVDGDSESSPVGDVSSDLLEGIEYFGKQLNIRQGDADGKEQKNEGDSRPDGLKSSKSAVSASAYVSRWKTILNSIAKQVSQVPLSLSIRVASLRGTVRLHIKPPPTDQLWFGFTSIPDIEFDLQSSVGDHKITSGHIALFLVNRFKTSIRESMVLPNCETVSIPWMLSEKDDWVPRKAAPFIWLNQEIVGGYADGSEASSSPPGEVKTKMESCKLTSSEHPGSKPPKPKNLECIKPQNTESPISSASTSSSASSSTQNSESLLELRMPLLASGEPQGTSQQDRDEIHECQSPSRSLVQLDKQNSAVEDDESKPKRMGRRAKMLDLGKKMGEKLEEKRRHLEEKSRHIVERMRGP